MWKMQKYVQKIASEVQYEHMDGLAITCVY